METFLLKLKGLRHVNLLNLLEFHVEQTGEEWRFDLLSESASQGSLSNILSITDVFGTSKARIFGLELLQALDYLHRNDIVHSNLSSDTVYLHQTIDGNTVVKVANVGMDNVSHQQSSSRRLVSPMRRLMILTKRNSCRW